MDTHKNGVMVQVFACYSWFLENFILSPFMQSTGIKVGVGHNKAAGGKKAGAASAEKSGKGCCS